MLSIRTESHDQQAQAGAHGARRGLHLRGAFVCLLFHGGMAMPTCRCGPDNLSLHSSVPSFRRHAEGRGILLGTVLSLLSGSERLTDMQRDKCSDGEGSVL